MIEQNRILFFRFICFILGATVFLIIWLALDYALEISLTFYILLLGGGYWLQCFTILFQLVYFDRKKLSELNRFEKIIHVILYSYVLIWIFMQVFSNVFSFGIFNWFNKESSVYLLLSIFILIFGFDKVVSQRHKDVFFTIYRVWITLESGISLILGSIILILTLLSFTNLPILIIISLSLAAISSILLSLTWIKTNN